MWDISIVANGLGSLVFGENGLIVKNGVECNGVEPIKLVGSI